MDIMCDHLLTVHIMTHRNKQPTGCEAQLEAHILYSHSLGGSTVFMPPWLTHRHTDR